MAFVPISFQPEHGLNALMNYIGCIYVIQSTWPFRAHHGIYAIYQRMQTYKTVPSSKRACTMPNDHLKLVVIFG